MKLNKFIQVLNHIAEGQPDIEVTMMTGDAFPPPPGKELPVMLPGTDFREYPNFFTVEEPDEENKCMKVVIRAWPY